MKQHFANQNVRTRRSRQGYTGIGMLHTDSLAATHGQHSGAERYRNAFIHISIINFIETP